MFGRGGASSTRGATATTAPRPVSGHSPMGPQASTGGGMMSGLAGTMMTGMAFGAGSEVAHQAVRGMMGGGTSPGAGHVEQPHGQTSPAQMSGEQLH